MSVTDAVQRGVRIYVVSGEEKGRAGVCFFAGLTKYGDYRVGFRDAAGVHWVDEDEVVAGEPPPVLCSNCKGTLTITPEQRAASPDGVWTHVGACSTAWQQSETERAAREQEARAEADLRDSRTATKIVLWVLGGWTALSAVTAGIIYASQGPPCPEPHDLAYALSSHCEPHVSYWEMFGVLMLIPIGLLVLGAMFSGGTYVYHWAGQGWNKS